MTATFTEVESLIDLETRRQTKRLDFTPLVQDQIEALIVPILIDLHDLTPQGPPVLQLDARHPYDSELGWLECYQAGRWDADTNLIMLTAIHQTGSSPGEWEGSVLYGYFLPPANGHYAFVVNYTGFSGAIHFNGPWGEQSKPLQSLYAPPQHQTIVAVAAGSQTMWFTVAGRGYGGVHVSSVQIYKIG